MSPWSRVYKGPGPDDKAVMAFRGADPADQWAMVQQIVDAQRWRLLDKVILQTEAVEDGLLCELPPGYEPDENVKNRWEEKLARALTTFEGLPEELKAERILQAEYLGEHGFLRLLILKTECVKAGFINRLPEVPPGMRRAIEEEWQWQRELAVKQFNQSTNQERFRLLQRIANLGQSRALEDLLEKGRIGRKGWPGEMPADISEGRLMHQKWVADIRKAVTTFGNLSRAQKVERLAEALVFQQTRFITELLRVSMDGFGQFVEWVPAAVLAAEDVDENWMRLRLAVLGRPSDSETGLCYRLQRLRSEPLTVEVARHLGVGSDATLFEAWKEGWMAHLRSRAVPLKDIPPEIAEDPCVVLGAWREGFGAAAPAVVLGVESYKTHRVRVALGERAGASRMVLGVWKNGAGVVDHPDVPGVGSGKLRAIREVAPKKAGDRGVVLGDWRMEPVEDSGVVNLSGVESGRRRMKRSGEVKVLKNAILPGAPARAWREGGAEDILEAREAWAWRWRRHLLLASEEMGAPPLQLQNIPQIREAWVVSTISNLDSEYSLCENGMPFPRELNVTLLNGGLLDAWAQAWHEFVQRDGKKRMIYAVPRELRSHPLIESLCRLGLVVFPPEILGQLSHSAANERRRARGRLLIEIKRTPIPAVLLPEALLNEADVRSAWSKGWESFFETTAMPWESVPWALRLDDSVCRAWMSVWRKALEGTLIPWDCVPEPLKRDAECRSWVVETWLGVAREEGWLLDPVPEDSREKEAVFFGWLREWYLLPQKREFLDATAKKPRVPRRSLEEWMQFLRQTPVRSLDEVHEDFRGLECVREAWKQGWIRALQRDAVSPDKIPTVLLEEETVLVACRSGWVSKMRLDPLSFRELPRTVREDPLVVEAMVQGWGRRIDSFKERDVWVHPPGAWLNAPVVDPDDFGGEMEGEMVGGLQTVPVSWEKPVLSSVWEDAHSKIREKLRLKITTLFARDAGRRDLALARHLGL